MIFGIGIDTIEVPRIAQTISDYGEQFVNRIFTQEETTYCMSRRFSAEHFAARFAAKEAFAKAIGTGIRHGFVWKEVEDFLLFAFETPSASCCCTSGDSEIIEVEI